MRLDEEGELLVNLCRHVLLKEGFPPFGLRKDLVSLLHCRTFVFSFQPNSSAISTTKLLFVLRLSIQNGVEDHLDIFLSSYLIKNDQIEISEYECNMLLWNTTLGNLEQESDQIISLLTDEFIVRYAGSRRAIADIRGNR